MLGKVRLLLCAFSCTVELRRTSDHGIFKAKTLGGNALCVRGRTWTYRAHTKHVLGVNPLPVRSSNADKVMHAFNMLRRVCVLPFRMSTAGYDRGLRQVRALFVV